MVLTKRFDALGLKTVRNTILAVLLSSTALIPTASEAQTGDRAPGNQYTWTGADSQDWFDVNNWSGLSRWGYPIVGYPGLTSDDFLYIGNEGVGSPVFNSQTGLTLTGLYIADGTQEGRLDFLSGSITVKGSNRFKTWGLVTVGEDRDLPGELGAGTLVIGGADAAYLETEELIMRQADSLLSIQNGQVLATNGIWLQEGQLQIGANGNLKSTYVEISEGAQALIKTAVPDAGISTRELYIDGQAVVNIRQGTLSVAGGDLPYDDIADIVNSTVTVGGGAGQALLRVSAPNSAPDAGNGLLIVSKNGSVELLNNGLLQVGELRLMDTSTLKFNGAYNGSSFNSTITGTGSVDVQQGALTFTAANTYSGPTQITGNVSLAGAGTLGTGVVTVDGALALNRLDAFTLPNSLAGEGPITQNSGTATLTGSGPYAGTLNVMGGSLIVEGDLSQADVLVKNGYLRANGKLKNVLVDEGGILDGRSTSADHVNIENVVVLGGTVRPGNSPGTLRVGNYLQVGGTIEFEKGDLIAVTTGQATLTAAADGTPVNIVLMDDLNNYTFGSVYTFVQAENGVMFTAPDVVLVDASMRERLFTHFETQATETQGNFFLVRQSSLTTLPSLDPIQLGVARALEAGTTSVGGGSVVYNSIISALPSQGNDVRVALNQLTGELHNSLKGVLIDESRFLRDAALNRTRVALGSAKGASSGQSVLKPMHENFAMWGQAYGSWGETGSTATTAKLTRSTGGFLLGADAGVSDNWRLGVVGGYGQTDIKANSALSSADVDNYNLALYGGGQWGAVGLRLGVGNTWHRIDSTRDINVSALSLRDTDRAHYDARSLQLFGEVGYALQAGAAMFEPFLNLAYVDYHGERFQERDMGLGSALWSRGSSMQTGFSTLGVRLSTDFEQGSVKGKFRGMLGWRYAYGDTNTDGIFAMSTMVPFMADGTPIQKSALVADLGVEAEITDGTTIGISYVGQIGRHAYDHGVKGGLTVKY